MRNKLSNIATFKGGSGFPEKYQGNSYGEYPFIKVSDMNLRLNNKKVIEANNYVNKDLVSKLGLTIFPIGSIVFAKVGAAIFLNRFRVLIKPTIIDNNMMAAIPKDCNDQYLYYSLSSINLPKYVQTGALPSINQQLFERIKIFTPPLPQQRKIANILSTCDRVIEKTQAAIAKYQAIKQGMMHDLFSRGIDLKTGKLRPKYEDAPDLYQKSALGMIPKEWEVKRLEEYLYLKSGEGITSESIETSGEYPVFGGNGLRGYTKSFTHEGEYVLIGRQGALCGNVVLASGKFYASEHAVVVTILDKSDTKWVEYKLYSMELNKYSEASAQPGLSVHKIYKLHTANSPSKEQAEISRRILSLERKIYSEQNTLNKYKILKSGLMQDLLSGEVEVEVEKENKGQVL